MQLLIVRHAIAFERDRRRWPDDAARPLTPAGMRRSRKAAAGLKAFSPVPDRLLTSPLVRAKETAQILTEVARWPKAEVVSELKPGQGAAALLSILAKDRRKRIAIVGHEPDLSRFLAACLSKQDTGLKIELKKNAAACLAFPGRARAGAAQLKWLATPRMLRGFRRSADR